MVASGPFSTAATRLAFEAGLGLWILKLALQGFKVRPEPLVLPLLCFFLASGAATLLSYSPWLSWERLRWYGLFLIFFLAVANLTSTRQVKALIAALMFSTTLSAVQTVWQFTAGFGVQLASTPSPQLFGGGLRRGDIIREVNGHPTRSPRRWERALANTSKDSVLKMRVARPFPGGVRYVYTAVQRADLLSWLHAGGQVTGARPPRAQGHFYHAIPYGGLLMEVAALGFGLAMAGWGERPVVRVLLVLALAALSFSLWATATRAYMIALLLGCVATVWVAAGWKARALAAAGMIAALAVSAAWVRNQRHVSMFNASEAGTEYRLLMWRDGLRLVRQHPLLGIGLDAERSEDNRFHLEAYQQFPQQHGHFHSTFMQVAVNCGLLGLALWTWLMLAYFRQLARLLRQEGQDRFERGLALGMLAAAIAFYVGCLVQYTLGDGEVMPVVWLQMGISVVLYRLGKPDELCRQTADPAGA